MFCNSPHLCLHFVSRNIAYYNTNITITVPITVPNDGRASEQLVPEDSDHIPFWASWETDTYIVVDQEAFEKACNQAIIAGWDGKLGSKGSYYRQGLPQGCGLKIASAQHSINSPNDIDTIISNGHHSRKYKQSRRGRRPHDNHDIDSHDEDDSDDEDENDDDTTQHSHHSHLYNHRHQHNHNMNHNGHNHNNNNNANNVNRPLFPPRVDFPEIVVQDLQARALPDGHNPLLNHNSSSDSRSENNSTPNPSEPPIKKQKLSNGRIKRTKMKRKRDDDNNNHLQSYDTPPQFVQHSLPLSVPFPGKVIQIPIIII